MNLPIECTPKKIERIKQDIKFIKLCIKNKDLLKEYHHKKYKSEFWKKVCFEYNFHIKGLHKTCKQLRDKFKYIYRSYNTIGNNTKSTNNDIKELEFMLKQELDVCFSFISYDQDGTLIFKPYNSKKKVNKKDHQTRESITDYENTLVNNPIFFNPSVRSSVSLSNVTNSTNDTTLPESEDIVTQQDIIDSIHFDSFPIYQSYINYKNHETTPENPDLSKSFKFIEELKTKSYSLHDFETFSNI